MQLTIDHTTTYRFEEPVHTGLQQLRLTPMTTHFQTVSNWVVYVDGGHLDLGFFDHHRNHVDLVTLDREATEVVIRCRGDIETTDTNGVVGRHFDPAPLWLFRRQTDRTRIGPAIRRLARQVEGETELARMHNLMAVIAGAVEYNTGSSAPDWTAEDVATEGHGVCQDHAHVFIACARELNMPARYVSGYLMMDDREEQDAMHAWAETHIEGLGWVGFDVSNAMCPDERYVRVATGLDYPDAAPVTGTRIGGSSEALSVQIQVAQQQ
ncbi:transglutaminase family protein [Pseudooceanicola batsensis]